MAEYEKKVREILKANGCAFSISDASLNSSVEYEKHADGNICHAPLYFSSIRPKYKSKSDFKRSGYYRYLRNAAIAMS